MDQLSSRVVGLDIDETLLASTEPVLAAFVREMRPGLQFGYQDLQHHDWWLHEELATSAEEVMPYWRAYFLREEGHYAIRAILWAREGVQRIKSLGAHTIGVTARHRDLKAPTERSMQAHFQSDVEHIIYLSDYDSEENGHIPTKSQACRDIGAELLVEDNPFHANAVASEVGIPVLMPLRPWNRRAELHPLVERLDSWDIITERAVEILSGKTCLSRR